MYDHLALKSIYTCVCKPYTIFKWNPPHLFFCSVAFRDRAECGVHSGGGGGGAGCLGGGVHRFPHAADTGGAHLTQPETEMRGTVWNLENKLELIKKPNPVLCVLKRCTERFDVAEKFRTILNQRSSRAHRRTSISEQKGMYHNLPAPPPFFHIHRSGWRTKWVGFDAPP